MIKVACLGAGYFSQFHLDGWARLNDVLCTGVADLDITRAKATGLPAFDNLAQLLAHDHPDVLDVILPPAAQAAAIRQAIASGVQTIICQKPFCQSLAEATDITELAERTSTALIIHENFRFQPWYRRIKTAIDDGSIGTVQQVTFRLRPGDGQGPDAYLDRQPYFQDMPQFLVHETGVHWIDTFRFLLGDPVAVYADLKRVNPVIKGEDAGVILFDHHNGATSMFDGNRTLDHAASNTRCTMGEALVEGTAGTLTLTGDGAVSLRKFAARDQTCLLAADRSGRFGGDCTHALQAHVVAALQGQRPFENRARDYLRVLAIKDAVYLSAQEHRKMDLQDRE